MIILWQNLFRQFRTTGALWSNFFFTFFLIFCELLREDVAFSPAQWSFKVECRVRKTDPILLNTKLDCHEVKSMGLYVRVSSLGRWPSQAEEIRLSSYFNHSLVRKSGHRILILAVKFFRDVHRPVMFKISIPSPRPTACPG